jgi:catechol 2,3-dioxygenase-like lactoylglutathione lyase family enzyme
MSVQGLSHITLIVKDADRTSGLLQGSLGAKEIYDSKGCNFSHSREKFFLLGGIWLAVMEGEPCDRSYRHVAFSVLAEDLPGLRQRLEKQGLEILPSRPRVEGEGESLYFYDFDNNLFELHTGTLKQRLKPYRGGRKP